MRGRLRRDAISSRCDAGNLTETARTADLLGRGPRPCKFSSSPRCNRLGLVRSRKLPITKSILSVVPARVSLDAERIKASWRGLPIEFVELSRSGIYGD